MNKPLPINYERDVPDYAESEYLHNHIDNILLLSESGEYSSYDVGDGLYELVKRLAENPGGIDDEHSTKVFEWLKLNWPSRNIEALDTAVSVLVNLRYAHMHVEFLREQLTKELTADEMKIIYDAISEYTA